MSPFRFFEGQPFPFNQSTNTPFQADYFQNIRQMMKQYQMLLNDDFWEHVTTMGQHHQKVMLPIEIWENDDFIFLSIIAPGLIDLNHVDGHFENAQLFVFHIQLRSIKPESAHTLLISELPKETYERDVFLPKAVDTMDYSVSLEKGMLTYMFKKVHERK